MILPDFLTRADGEIRVTGRRIGLYAVVCLYCEGWTAEQIAEEFELDLDLVHKVLAFCLENQVDVDAYRAELERQEAMYSGSPVAEKYRRLRELLRQADERFGSELGWEKVPILEKLRRIREATAPPTV